MERQFITPPTTEIYESCEERFNTIVEYLQECVDEDQMTVEEANEIADLAYNKYIVEARAVDKWLANREDKINKARNSIANSSLLIKDKKKMDDELSKKKYAYGARNDTDCYIRDDDSDTLLVGRKKGRKFIHRGPGDKELRGNKHTIYTRDSDEKEYYSKPVPKKKPGTILAAQNEKRKYRKMIDDID